jgi:hypothetical protein
MITSDISKHTKPHYPSCNQMHNRRMATIVTWALYLSTGICWQEPELLFGTLFTLAVSRNNRFLHASLPSLIQAFRLPATTYINFLSLPILHFLPRPLFLYSDSSTSTVKAAMQYNHSGSVRSINSSVSSFRSEQRWLTSMSMSGRDEGQI